MNRGREKMNEKKIIIGSRESRLAVIQSEMVKAYIEEHNKDCCVELLTMKTTGDKIGSVSYTHLRAHET